MFPNLLRMTAYFSKDPFILNHIWNSPRFIFSHILSEKCTMFICKMEMNFNIALLTAVGFRVDFIPLNAWMISVFICMYDISVFQSKHFKGAPKYICKICICLLVMFVERVCTIQIWVYKKKLDCLELHYPIFMAIRVYMQIWQVFMT